MVAVEPSCPVCGVPLPNPDHETLAGVPYVPPANCPFCRVALTLEPAVLPAQESAIVAMPPLPPPPKRSRRTRRVLIGGGFVLAAAIVLLLLGASAGGVNTTLLLATVAAVIPAVVYSRLILTLDRYEQEPRNVVLFAFLWGAFGAVLFSVIAEVAFSSFFVGAAGEEGASVLSLVVGAPFIEEFCKALALLVLLGFYRHELDNVLDGLIYGALIGLGFAMTENVLYFISAYAEDGIRGLGELFVIRAVLNGFGHALYTGTTGAAIGWSRSRHGKGWGRFAVPVAGFLLGVLLHMLWNGGVLVIAGLQGEDATIWSVLAVEMPLFVIPPLIILYLIARRSATTELSVMKQELAQEVDLGVLTPEEFGQITDHRRRRAALRAARSQGGMQRLRTQRSFFGTAGDLAYAKHHHRQGETLTPDDWIALRAKRLRIASLRQQLGRVTQIPELAA